MGRASKTGDLKSGELFPDSEVASIKPPDNLPLETPAIRQAMAKKAPAQTDAKSRLIANYISKFQIVTRGGLYIDGFAGPQNLAHEDAWTARRVLEIEPKRLRTFWLCDNDEGGLDALSRLKDEHHRSPDFRRVFVHKGDFNEQVNTVLKAGRIKRRSAVFALLDQRNTECHWETVRRLASFKGRTRIELLYFLGVGWLHRSLTQSRRAERIEEITRWWGRDDWGELVGQNQLELQITMARRFQEELGYRFANFWPIYLRERGKRTAFSLLHATDHEEAPKLMRRAFLEIYGDREGSPVDSQRNMF